MPLLLHARTNAGDVTTPPAKVRSPPSPRGCTARSGAGLLDVVLSRCRSVTFYWHWRHELIKGSIKLGVRNQWTQDQSALEIGT